MLTFRTARPVVLCVEGAVRLKTHGTEMIHCRARLTSRQRKSRASRAGG